MTKDEALKRALEMLEELNVAPQDYDFGPAYEGAKQRRKKAITAVKEALAAPVATDWERIARVQDAKLRAMCNEPKAFEQLCEIMDRYEDLRPTPPAAQRQWVGLTDEELLEAYGWSGPCEIDFIAAAARTELLGGLRKVEAKLKEKNT